MSETERASRGRVVRAERSASGSASRERASASHTPAGRASVGDLDMAVSASPLQLLQFERALTTLHDAVARHNVQMQGGADGAGVQAIAQRGLSGGGGPLPHLERIQRSFGRHDVSGVKGHTGGEAQSANRELGALGYASGNDVAFRGAPSLHTAAHEAAHVVQQRAGVALKGGIGQVGDRYERHADQVADAVVQGKSAEALLDPFAGSGAGAAVQMESAEAGAHVQRKASEGSDTSMWEDMKKGVLGDGELKISGDKTSGVAKFDESGDLKQVGVQRKIASKDIYQPVGSFAYLKAGYEVSVALAANKNNANGKSGEAVFGASGSGALMAGQGSKDAELGVGGSVKLSGKQTTTMQQAGDHCTVDPVTLTVEASINLVSTAKIKEIGGISLTRPVAKMPIVRLSLPEIVDGTVQGAVETQNIFTNGADLDAAIESFKQDIAKNAKGAGLELYKVMMIANVLGIPGLVGYGAVMAVDQVLTDNKREKEFNDNLGKSDNKMDSNQSAKVNYVHTGEAEKYSQNDALRDQAAEVARDRDAVERAKHASAMAKGKCNGMNSSGRAAEIKPEAKAAWSQGFGLDSQASNMWNALQGAVASNKFNPARPREVIELYNQAIAAFKRGDGLQG